MSFFFFNGDLMGNPEVPLTSTAARSQYNWLTEMKDTPEDPGSFWVLHKTHTIDLLSSQEFPPQRLMTLTMQRYIRDDSETQPWWGHLGLLIKPTCSFLDSLHVALFLPVKDNVLIITGSSRPVCIWWRGFNVGGMCNRLTCNDWWLSWDACCSHMHYKLCFVQLVQ